MDSTLVLLLCSAYQDLLLHSLITLTTLQRIPDNEQCLEGEIVFERASIPEESDEIVCWIVLLLSFLSPEETERVLAHLCPLFRSVEDYQERMWILEECQMLIDEQITEGVNIIRRIQIALSKQ